jgi:hypothetical protein
MGRKLFALVLLAIACVSCVPHNEPDEAVYLAGFKKVCHEYALFARDLNTQPSPYKPGMARPERNVAYAKVANDAANQFAKFANEETALHADARFDSIHAEALKLYQLEADRWRDYSKVVAQGDQEAGPQLAQQMLTDTRSQYGKLTAEAENIKEDPSIADAVHQMDLPDPTRNAPRGI